MVWPVVENLPTGLKDSFGARRPDRRLSRVAGVGLRKNGNTQATLSILITVSCAVPNYLNILRIAWGPPTKAKTAARTGGQVGLVKEGTTYVG